MRLIKVTKEAEIPREHLRTPIGELLRYHNLKAPFQKCQTARLLVSMCMDNRKQLALPENFAYIIRTGGANLRDSEFKVSSAVAIGRLRHVILIGHNDCGMVNLMSRKVDFVNGLVTIAGWERVRARSIS